LKDIEKIIKKESQSEILVETIESEAKSYRLAFDAAAKYLKSAKTEYEVKNKLYEKGFHKNDIDQVIEKMKYYGYIDDLSYAKAYVKRYIKKIGRNKIEYKLTYEKHVAQNVVSEAFNAVYVRNEEYDVCKNTAIKYAIKRHLKLDMEGKTKISNHLYMRGYNWSIIGSVMSALKDTDLLE